MEIKYGFEMGGMKFGWFKKKLYRLPQIYNERLLPLRKLEVIEVGNNKGYRCNKNKLSIAQVESITKEIKPVIIRKGNKDLPF